MSTYGCVSNPRDVAVYTYIPLGVRKPATLGANAYERASERLRDAGRTGTSYHFMTPPLLPRIARTTPYQPPYALGHTRSERERISAHRTPIDITAGDGGGRAPCLPRAHMAYGVHLALILCRLTITTR